MHQVRLNYLIDILLGIAGVVTNPYQSAKREGVKGFFKGIGTGALGLVVSPFAATLNLASNVTGGISATGSKIAHGKVQKQGRFRHPRYINPTGILEVYDEAISEASLILLGINREKYADEFIRFIANCYTYKKDGERTEECVFIITDRRLLSVKDLTIVRQKIKIRNIKSVDTQTDGMDKITKNR